MGTLGPEKVKRNSTEFKLTAFKMSLSPGMLLQDVADSLCIHPFMLSRWRKEIREGSLTGEAVTVDHESMAELKRLREIEVKYKRLEQEHDLLEKAIRLDSEWFCSGEFDAA